MIRVYIFNYSRYGLTILMTSGCLWRGTKRVRNISNISLVPIAVISIFEVMVDCSLFLGLCLWVAKYLAGELVVCIWVWKSFKCGWSSLLWLPFPFIIPLHVIYFTVIKGSSQREDWTWNIFAARNELRIRREAEDIL